MPSRIAKIAALPYEEGTDDSREPGAPTKKRGAATASGPRKKSKNDAETRALQAEARVKALEELVATLQEKRNDVVENSSDEEEENIPKKTHCELSI